MDRLILVFLVIAVIFSLVSYVLWRLTKGRKSITYFLPFACLALSIYNFYFARSGGGEGFEDLAAALFAMMSFVAFLSGLATLLILDWRKKKP